MTSPNKLSLCDYKKLAMCFSLEWLDQFYAFWLPTHKTNITFEGSHIIIKCITHTSDPFPIMQCYIQSQDQILWFHPQLWLKSDSIQPVPGLFIAYITILAKHGRPINVCWRCFCIGRSRSRAYSHQRCREMIFCCFQALHTKKSGSAPCTHTFPDNTLPLQPGCNPIKSILCVLHIIWLIFLCQLLHI